MTDDADKIPIPLYQQATEATQRAAQALLGLAQAAAKVFGKKAPAELMITITSLECHLNTLARQLPVYEPHE